MEASSSSRSNGATSNKSEDPPKSQAITFTVDFDESPKIPRRMPKQLSSAKLKNKRKLSEETMAEKQRLAEERRKKHIEDRLERIHQLEEEAQRLAQAMAPMLKSSQDPKLLNGESDVHKLHKDTDMISSVIDEEVMNMASYVPTRDTEHVDGTQQ